MKNSIGVDMELFREGLDFMIFVWCVIVYLKSLCFVFFEFSIVGEIGRF